MADTKIRSELRVAGESKQTKCVLVNDNKIDSLIGGLRQMSQMTSQLLSEHVERERSGGKGEEEEDEDEDDEDEEELKPDKQPPAKKTKNT